MFLLFCQQGTGSQCAISVFPLLYDEIDRGLLTVVVVMPLTAIMKDQVMLQICVILLKARV